MKKRDIVNENQREIEREREKWENYKQAEEKKIRMQAESAMDAKLKAYQDRIIADGEKESK